MKIVINIENKHMSILEYLSELQVISHDSIIQRLLEKEAVNRNYFEHLEKD
jgi:DNA-binding winged helix-turn-helix (wHTH) protein